MKTRGALEMTQQMSVTHLKNVQCNNKQEAV